MKQKSHVRRTHYGELNKLVWNYFKQCQSTGVVVNGKHLRDQALKFARQLGLDAFRGSEGWLDAFKRRHQIELKTMTGYPVCYDEDGVFANIEMDQHLQNTQHQNVQFFGNSVASAPEEFASSFFNSLNGFQQQPVMPPQQPESAASLIPLRTMINSMISNPTTAPLFMDSAVAGIHNLPSTSNESQDVSNRPSLTLDEIGSRNQETIQAVLKSCQIKIEDKDVNFALNTLRTYILTKVPEAMGLLVQLQEMLAAVTPGIKETENAVSSSS